MQRGYNVPQVLAALCDYDLYDRVRASIKAGWFQQPNKEVFQAIVSCHKDYPGRIVPWQDIILRLEGKKGFDRAKGLSRTTSKSSRVAKQHQLSKFLEAQLLQDIVEDLAKEQEEGRTINHAKYIERLEAAQRAGSLQTKELEYFKMDIEQRLEEIKHIPVISFPVETLTAAFDGGMAAGQLFTVLSKTDGGKTMFCVNCGRHAVQCGKNVLHSTHETSRIEVASRYDCSFTKHSVDWIKKNKELAHKKLLKVQASGGNLVIEDFSGIQASVSDIQTAAERMVRKHGSVDLLLVDYGDLVVPNLRANEDGKGRHRQTWAELRRLGKNLCCPVVCPTQSNRVGAAASEVELVHIGLDWGKATDSDAVIGVHAPPDTDRAFLIIMKTKRKGGYKKIPVKFDRIKCLIEDIG